MSRYAEGTSVSSEKTRAEIERTLTRYGATKFLYGWSGEQALIGFEMEGRHIRFLLPLPDRDSDEFRYVNRNQHHREMRTSEGQQRAWEQACCQRWRALLLVIKAKLEAVESGITTLESEFLAATLLPDGRTVGEWAKPQLEESYRTGRMPALLPGLPNGERPALTTGKE